MTATKTAYQEGADYARRAVQDSQLSSVEAILYAQQRQGEFHRGFDDALGGAAKKLMAGLRAAGADL